MEAFQSLPAEDSGRSDRLHTILLVAFGGLLALMLLAGLDSLRTLRQLDTAERLVHERYAAHSQALSAIVVSAHSYNDQMERFLITGSSALSIPTVQEVTESGIEAEAAVQSFPADRDIREQDLLTQIADNLKAQEVTFVRVSGWRIADRSRHAQEVMSEEILPRRFYILQESREIIYLNSQHLGEANAALAASYAGLKNRIAITLSSSLAAGLLLSLIGGLYILRLERRGRDRYEALVSSRRQLEELSARLVDAQEAERQVISRELHDEVGQTLGALVMELGQMSKLASPADQIAQSQIARIKSIAERAVSSVRDIALLLRPPMLDDLGLIPALEWQGREVSRRSNLEVAVHSEGVFGRLSNDLKVCIYRVVQEALNNAATHSDAKNAKVTIIQKNNLIDVRVQDDGSGFDPAKTRGMGLLGMEERVKRLNGSFRVVSGSGKGTTIHADLPVLNTGAE